MKSYSQAGQDILVQTLVPKPGVFLDIGAAGLTISNTLALQAMGWYGWLLDNSPEAYAAQQERYLPFIVADATTYHYGFLPPLVDYGSFDIDGATLNAMTRVFSTAPHTRFRVITAEHDFYSRGNLLRLPMLELLVDNGYEILCADVCHEGKSFEIWAVHPDLVDMKVANKIRYNTPADWKEILELD